MIELTGEDKMSPKAKKGANSQEAKSEEPTFISQRRILDQQRGSINYADEEISFFETE